MDFLPKLIAHRGASTLAPENTLASLRAAKEKGAQFIEFDVMLTADNVPVIFHDKTLERTTNGKGKLSKTLFAELRKLDAGSWFSPNFAGEKVPTLQEYVQAAADLGLGINIELKASSGKEAILAQAVLQTLQNHWSATLPAPLLSSFSVSNLKALRELNCTHPLALNVQLWNKRIIALAAKLNCYSIHLDAQDVTPKRINFHLAHNFKTLVHPVNDKVHAEQLFSYGVTAIFSDIPDLIS